MIRVPVKTTNSVGISITTESLSTAAATAFANIVIASIVAPGSTVLHTSQVPAVVYTTTDSQGAIVIVTSALVPSSAGSMASATPAPEQNSANPQDDGNMPGSPSHDESGNYPNNGSLGNVNENSSVVSKPTKHAGLAEEVPQSNADAGSQSGAQSGNASAGSQSGTQSGNASEDASAGSQSETQAGNASGNASNGDSASKSQSTSNISQGDQPNSVQNSNSAGQQDQQQSQSQEGSAATGGSSPTTTATSSPLNHSPSAESSSTYNSSDLKVGSGFDQLANSGLASLIANTSAVTQFVQDTLSSQTDAQQEAFRSQLNAQFAKLVDGLFAVSSSSAAAAGGQPGSQQANAQGSSQQTAAQQQQAGTQDPSPQDLANESCSSLGEMHARLVTEVFFMETTVNTIYRQYTNVRDVIMQQCQ